MKANFNSQYKTIVEELKQYVKKGDRSKGNKVQIKDENWSINRAVVMIAKVEMASSFLLGSLEVPKIKDVWEIFSYPTNADVPIFKKYAKEKVAKLQETFNWHYKNSIKDAFDNYKKLPQEWKILKFAEEKIILKPNARSKKMYQRYLDELERKLEYSQWKKRTFKENKTLKYLDNVKKVYYKSSKDIEKEIPLDKEIREYLQENYQPITMDMSPVEQEKVKIIIGELKIWAKEMDQLEKENLESKDWNYWNERVKELVFSIPEDDKLVNKPVIIDGMLNALGALSVGKSTIIQVVSYGLAVKRNKRCSIMLNSTNEVFEMVNKFNKLGMNAVPLMSNNRISDHLKSYLSMLENNKEVVKDANNSFRYVNSNCLLKNINIHKGLEIEDDTNPCNRLYIKNKEGKEGIICPFVTDCPRFNRMKDLNQAQIVITTVNSAVQSKLPAPFFTEKITILEYLYQTCNITFVDEADRAQNTLDSTFCSKVNVLGGKDSLYHIQSNEQIEDEFQRKINLIKNDSIEIKGALESAIDERKLFEHNIYGELIRGKILWKDLFDQIIGYSKYDKYALDENDKLNKVYKKLRKSFVQTFNNFATKMYNKRGFNDRLYQLWRSVSGEHKHDEDFNKFVEQEVKNFFETENVSISPEEIREFPNLHKNWNKPLKKTIEQIKPKITLITRLFMIKFRLKFILKNWLRIKSFIKKPINNQLWLLNSLKREYAAVMPKTHGLNYGFQLKERKENEPFKIEYRNYEGVGRWLLLNLHKLYRDINGVQTNVVLLSGTSKFEKSTRYHIQLPTDMLITSKEEQESELLMELPKNIPIKVSGTPRKKRDNNFAQLVSLIHEQTPIYDGDNYIQAQLNNSKCLERRRAIFVVGSYKDSDILAKHLLDYQEDTKALVCPEEKEKDYHLPRNKIEKAAKLGVKYLSMPLGVGRGYNIMIETDDGFVAGFNTIFFAKRPYYIPYDITTMVSWVNYSYIKTINKYKSGEISDINSLKKELIKQTNKSQRDFENMYGYASLSDGQREKLLADTLVEIYQFACRAIRGNSKARIIFTDSSFAPKTMKGECDDERTSMIIGWRELLKELINQSKPTEKKIYCELYQILLNGLKMIRLNEK
ncbi:hypothetical protein MWH25_02275 [Natroniella acetigena]|uniref:hypothetical protein n=1 Tax=Natroniella acetigena TaxID=52004 RepID=UPI00200B7BCC|nr:hypothetical protein [Natroniella acetigena]MCK8826576.1 hypothetical protein [Natroniella acetigena]